MTECELIHTPGDRRPYAIDGHVTGDFTPKSLRRGGELSGPVTPARGTS